MAVYNGTNSADNFTGTKRGTAYSDTYYTYGGNDIIDSYFGDDYVSAGSGADTVYAGDGNDQIYGGDDGDNLYGDLGNDTINGDAGNDLIDGGLQNDMLYGGAGNDVFAHNGLAGWDSYYGGSDFDTIRLVNVSPDALWGLIQISYLTEVEKIENLQSIKPVDIAMTGSLDLSLVEVDGIRSIVGSAGNDAITGTSNSLSSSINDSIDAKEGNDILAGGLGNDTLRGGAGADRFVFGKNEGSDVVADFTDGSDVIDLRPADIIGFGDLLITADGANTKIVADGTSITLMNVNPSMLDASDFLF